MALPNPQYRGNDKTSRCRGHEHVPKLPGRSEPHGLRCQTKRGIDLLQPGMEDQDDSRRMSKLNDSPPSRKKSLCRF